MILKTLIFILIYRPLDSGTCSPDSSYVRKFTDSLQITPRDGYIKKSVHPHYGGREPHGSSLLTLWFGRERSRAHTPYCTYHLLYRSYS